MLFWRWCARWSSSQALVVGPSHEQFVRFAWQRWISCASSGVKGIPRQVPWLLQNAFEQIKSCWTGYGITDTSQNRTQIFANALGLKKGLLFSCCKLFNSETKVTIQRMSISHLSVNGMQCWSSGYKAPRHIKTSNVLIHSFIKKLEKQILNVAEEITL